MLKFGADRIFANAEGKPPTDAELDALIDRSAKVAATAGKPRLPNDQEVIADNYFAHET